MLCDICNKREASVFVKKIKDGEVMEQKLCDICALNSAFTAVSLDEQSEGYGDLAEMLAGFMDDKEPSLHDGGDSCSVCGSSFSGFQQTGRLGCSECYNAFSGRLEPLMKRLQGSVQHIGKAPPGKEKWEEIDKLREELGLCIKDEEYERAAVIRDRIRYLQDKAGLKERG